MIIVKIHEAKTHFSKLIQKVCEGKEIIISKGNKPFAKLVKLPEVEYKRKLGSAKGKLKIADDFEKPLEDFKDYSS